MAGNGTEDMEFTAAPAAVGAPHAYLNTDLAVYLRQSHAERDFAVLGNLAAGAAWWQLW